MKESIKSLGLTENDFIIYKILLKLGAVSAGPIIKNTGIASSRVYISLNSLLEKGLVSFYKENNKMYFIAEEPETLLSLLDKTKETLKLEVKELKQIQKTSEQEFESRVYEGFVGFKKAFEILIDEAKSKDEIIAIGFSVPVPALEKLRSFLNDIDRRRIHKKVKLRIIFEKSVPIAEDREKEPYTKVRYMPKGYSSPTAINVLKDYVLIEIWGDKPIVLLIKNRKVSESFRNYFEFLWKLGKS